MSPLSPARFRFTRLTVQGASCLLAAALVAGALPACKPKPKGAKVEQRVEQAPKAQLSASTDPWQDLLKDEDRLALQNGAQVTKGELRLTTRATATIRDSGSDTDGAVRLISAYEPAVPGVIINARIQDTGSRYSLSVKSEALVRIGQVLGSGEEMPLKDFPLKTPLAPGQSYELEFRVVGSTLSAKLNGNVLGEIKDSSLANGMMSVGLDVASPTVIAALQYLPLGSSTPVTTGATEQWTNVLENQDFLGKNAALKKEEDGYLLTGYVTLQGKPSKNCAVKITVPMASRSSALRIGLRSSKEGSYQMSMQSNRGVSVRGYVNEPKSDSLLIDQPLPGTAQQLDDLELEVRAVGPRISVKANGEEIAFAEDTKVKEGAITLGIHKQAVETYGEPKIKKLEYVILEAQ